MYVHVHICMYVCMYVYMHVCIYACMYACVYVYMHACMYVSIRVCIYVYACVYVCMYGDLFVVGLYWWTIFSWLKNKHKIWLLKFFEFIFIFANLTVVFNSRVTNSLLLEINYEFILSHKNMHPWSYRIKGAYAHWDQWCNTPLFS